MLQLLNIAGEIFVQLFRSVFALSSQVPLLPAPTIETQAVYFCEQWDSLGPWRLGTREAAWGSDPLEAYGGFKDLSYNFSHTYYSQLTKNATVHWESSVFTRSTLALTASVTLKADYPYIDWDSIQRAYGWAVLQYQAWFRGWIINPTDSNRAILLHTKNIIEFWVNDQPYYGGDLYGFGKAPVLVLLEPGISTLNVRLVHDVRAMGGDIPPVIQASIRADTVTTLAEVVQSSLVLPDVVSEKMSGGFASIVVRNQGTTWISITGVATSFGVNIIYLKDPPVLIAPGQSRPLSFSLDFPAEVPHEINATIEYVIDESQERYQLPFVCNFKMSDTKSPHKITFLHPSGTVSYAILRPPSANLVHRNSSVPILLSLHGASLEADSHQVRHTLDGAADLPAWIIFPTGMSPWSGDDWHIWGFADVEAAIAAIPEWIRTTRWKGSKALMDKYFVSGHSNGGQGTWFFTTHQPDKVLAAVPASGYSSIDNYVPYVMWNEADPAKSTILEKARMNYRHELLIDNIIDIPILDQHGEDDDNVPVYHSRLMSTLRAQARGRVDYVELAGRGHWFNGVMTTKPLLAFYHDHLHGNLSDIIPPQNFSFVCPNSHELGSRYGIEIDQLRSPDQLGRIDVSSSHQNGVLIWHIKTSNIFRLHFNFARNLSKLPDLIFLDRMSNPITRHSIADTTTYRFGQQDNWHTDDSQDWRSLESRYGRQRGALESIMRTQGAFQVVYCSREAFPISVQITRNLFQYFNADSNILDFTGYQQALIRAGNLITIALGNNVPLPRLEAFPIHISPNDIAFRVQDGYANYSYDSQSLGGLWLRPLENQRLELVIWGSDLDGLRQAARLAPTLTGIGQPDFVLLSKTARCQGHAKSLALGFLDHSWNISKGSFFS